MIIISADIKDDRCRLVHVKYTWTVSFLTLMNTGLSFPKSIENLHVGAEYILEFTDHFLNLSLLTNIVKTPIQSCCKMILLFKTLTEVTSRTYRKLRTYLSSVFPFLLLYIIKCSESAFRWKKRSNVYN